MTTPKKTPAPAADQPADAAAQQALELVAKKAAEKLAKKAARKKQAKIIQELSRERNRKAVIRTKNRALR